MELCDNIIVDAQPSFFIDLKLLLNICSIQCSIEMLFLFLSSALNIMQFLFANNFSFLFRNIFKILYIDDNNLKGV